MVWPFHPLLLALYPSLALLASNGEQVGPAAALRPALLTALAAGLGFLALLVKVRNPHRSAALTSLALAAFFSYGHVYDLLKTAEVGGEVLGRHRYLVPLFSAGMAGCAWAIFRLRRPRDLSRLLNSVGLMLVFLPGLTIAMRGLRLAVSPVERGSAEVVLDLEAPSPAPDIYFIVLDGYTRADVLRDQFGVDNRPFLAELERLGFQVADCAQSNYAQTELTLASALNLDLLDGLGDFPSESRDRTPLLFLVRDSLVRRSLELIGYATVAFETGYAWSEWSDAEVYLRPATGGGWGLPLSPFESLLIDSTALGIVTDARSALPPAMGGIFEGPLELHRQRVTFALEELPRLARRVRAEVCLCPCGRAAPPVPVRPRPGFNDG